MPPRAKKTEVKIKDVSGLVKEYGPLTSIWRDREKELLKEGKWRHILTLTTFDGDTEDSHSLNSLDVGHHLVNVEAIYETAKPMPEGLSIEDKDIWFGDDGLPES